MRTTFVSTLSLLNSPRTNAAKLQAELAKANTEITTGRYSDIGLQLGHRVSQSITLRQEHAELGALSDANALTSIRLSVSQASLNNVRESADAFLNTVLAVPSSPTGPSIIQETARANLKSLITELNQSTNGQYIFAGIDTKQKPIADYASGSGAKIAVDDAFTSFFGFSQSSPLAQEITASKMSEFLDSKFAPLFDETNWSVNWSSAQSRNIESRISPVDRIETSTNANEAAFRKLAMAYTMASELAIPNLPQTTRQVVLDKLVGTIGSASTEIVQIQANLGTAEKRISDANERMSLQQAYLNEGVGGLESVDPAEAKTRVDFLTTQIQMSYSLTSQLRQLSLLNYI